LSVVSACCNPEGDHDPQRETTAISRQLLDLQSARDEEREGGWRRSVDQPAAFEVEELRLR